MLTKNYFIYSLLAILLIMAVVQPTNARRKKKKSRKRNRPAPTESYNRTTCVEIKLPMCSNLIPYSVTQLIHKKEGSVMTQGQLSSLLEPLWAYMDTECSPQFREMACGHYLPKCHPNTGQPMRPCRSVCRAAKKGCNRIFSAHNINWPNEFKCSNFPTKNCVGPSNLTHITPVEETGTRCILNTIPMCANLTPNTNKKKYVLGVLPNMFLQNSPERIFKEMNNYKDLIATNCSRHLAFFVCGVYLPFCTDNQGADGFRVPCREVCEEVYNSCKDVLTRISGVDWPSKFQCHRYPSKESTNSRLQCLEPSQIDIARKGTLPTKN
ncbi:protein mom-5-like [Argonauta hians]